MPTPFGHGLAALALAALVGLDEPADLASFIGGALAPDGDLVAGLVLRGDPMELHRRFGSHSPLALGLAAVGAAALTRGRARSATLAAVGAALHLAMDSLPWVYMKAQSTAARGWPQFVRSVIVNSAFDIAVLGPFAYAAWRWCRNRR
ncbi:MAG TPA: metal-dependent hydrolase [Dehalococcoidia bacterium]|nr:metal-dependent hydrolase [Dehalococcoidia bacterium]